MPAPVVYIPTSPMRAIVPATVAERWTAAQDHIGAITFMHNRKRAAERAALHIAVGDIVRFHPERTSEPDRAWRVTRITGTAIALTMLNRPGDIGVTGTAIGIGNAHWLIKVTVLNPRPRKAADRATPEAILDAMASEAARMVQTVRSRTANHYAPARGTVRPTKTAVRESWQRAIGALALYRHMRDALGFHHTSHGEHLDQLADEARIMIEAL